MSKGGNTWLEGLRNLRDADEIRKNLMLLKGVGQKVADSVTLYAMDKP